MLDPNASAIEIAVMEFALAAVLLGPVSILLYGSVALIRRIRRRLQPPAFSFLDVIERR